MPIFVLLVSNGVLFDGAFSLRISLKSSALGNIGNEPVFKINTTDNLELLTNILMFLFGTIYF